MITEKPRAAHEQRELEEAEAKEAEDQPDDHHRNGDNDRLGLPVDVCGHIRRGLRNVLQDRRRADNLQEQREHKDQYFPHGAVDS